MKLLYPIIALLGVLNLQAVERPNIILVLTDDQGYGDLACHGHPFIQTPNIDALYEQSTCFTDFHASSSCSPTRSALMSGLAPFKVGVTHTAEPRCRMALSATTIAEVLQGNGYRTGIFGKWHLGDEAPYQPENRGFDEVFIHGGGGIAQSQPPSPTKLKINKVRGYFDPIIKHNDTIVQTSGYCTDVFFLEALSWMENQSNAEQPFFAFISTNAPHAPFVVADQYSELYRGKCSSGPAAFYGMITNIDENVGRLMKKLDEWDIADNTLLIFMTDNGSSGGSKIFNAGMKGRKGENSEGGDRVPLFMRLPGKIPAGQSVDRLTRHYDLFPTLVEVAGVRLPSDLKLDGRSLMPLIENPKTTDWKDRYTFFHTAKWKPGMRDEDKHRKFSVRSEKWRLDGPSVKTKGSDQTDVRLYDIEKDPGQTVDLAEAFPQVYQEMLEAYNLWWDSVIPFMVNDDIEFINEKPFLRQYEQAKAAGEILTWQRPKSER